MTNTDSRSVQDLVASISLRENERGVQIGSGWDPQWHQPTDVFTTFSDKDFRLGLNAGADDARAPSRGLRERRWSNDPMEDRVRRRDPHHPAAYANHFHNAFHSTTCRTTPLGGKTFEAHARGVYEYLVQTVKDGWRDAAWVAKRFETRFESFGHWDRMLFPVMRAYGDGEYDTVEIARMSPLDAYLLAPQESDAARRSSTSTNSRARP